MDSKHSVSAATTQPQPEATESKSAQFLSKWKKPGNRVRLLHTLWLFLSFIAMGFIAGQRGPSFLDLQLITNTDVELAAFFFTSAAIGGLLGALVIGALYDKFNKIRLIFLTNVGMGLCVGVIPHCSQYYVMIAAWFCTGFCMRGLETGGTADVVRVWKSESRPYMFIVHLGFSIGSLISPLITEPFLVPKQSLIQTFSPNISELRDHGLVLVSHNSLVQTDTATFSPNNSKLLDNPVNISNSVNNNLTNSSTYNNLTSLQKPPNYDKQLHYAYMISAVLAVLTSIPFFIKSCKKENIKRSNSPVKVGERQTIPFVHYVISVLLMIMYICNTGIEDAFSVFLMTFTVKQLNWTKSQGALVTSTFWAALITARVLVIFIANLVSPARLILIAMCFVVTSLIGLCVCAIYLAHTGIWVFVCIAGAAISILFPTGISLTDQELIPVNGKVSSFILVAGAIGLLCNPVVLGFLIKEFSALWFCYLLLAEALVSIVTILIILVYGRKVLRKIRKRTVVEFDVSVSFDRGVADNLINGTEIKSLDSNNKKITDA